jgi:hypothetical protein
VLAKVATQVQQTGAGLSRETFIGWHDGLAIGIEPFDREHRDPVDASNALHTRGGPRDDMALFAHAVDRRCLESKEIR